MARSLWIPGEEIETVKSAGMSHELIPSIAGTIDAMASDRISLGSRNKRKAEGVLLSFKDKRGEYLGLGKI